MKNKNYITKYLIIILPLLFINLNAQDQVDAIEETTATEKVESTEAAAEEVAIAEEADEVEELAVKEELGLSIGVTGSVGFVNGAYITNTPIGGSLVINTPLGFKIGKAVDFGISLTLGYYNGEGNSDPLNALLYGVGGNLILVNFVFVEGHAGQIGQGPGVRGFAGISLERLMNKGLNLPVNILIGGEGFLLTEADEVTGNATYWGGLGVRLDYDF